MSCWCFCGLGVVGRGVDIVGAVDCGFFEKVFMCVNGLSVIC